MRAVLCLVLLLFPFIASAKEPLRPNTEYHAGTTLTLDAQGVTFTVPEGWSGGLAGDYFVMTHATSRNILAAVLEEANAAEVQAFLSLPQTLPGDISYQPMSLPKQEGDLITVTATVSDGAQRVPTEVIARLSPYGWAIGVFAIIVDEPDREATLASAMAAIRTATLAEPVLPEAGAFTGPWVETLVNKTLTHRSSTDTTSDHFSFTFCADGSFSFYSSQSGASTTDFNDGSQVSVTHLGTGSDQGRWGVQGATIYLWYDNGKHFTKEITTNDDGNLFLDGTRYYRGGEACQ